MAMMENTKKRGSRTGFTTGACAAAAARAAAYGLQNGQVPQRIACDLPNGDQVEFAIHDSRLDKDGARAVVIKDAGDDPDCTHGAHLTVDVRVNAGPAGQVRLFGGDGVGKITLPGLGLEVGGPAINPVPRKNIEDNVRKVAADLLKQKGLDITISVPQGEEMAKKTLNARLGIIGGISILGTSGIVRPYSTAAFRASVIQAIEVAASQGQTTVVLTTGGRTEKFVMDELPDLAQACFIQMGDFLSYALDTAVAQQMRQVIIGGMVGKLTKMAQGETITHAGRNAVSTDLLSQLAAQAGADEQTCHEIAQAETARFAAEKMEQLGLSQRFHHLLAQKVVDTLSERYPHKFQIQVLVCDFDGNKIAAAEGNDYVA